MPLIENRSSQPSFEEWVERGEAEEAVLKKAKKLASGDKTPDQEYGIFTGEDEASSEIEKE